MGKAVYINDESMRGVYDLDPVVIGTIFCVFSLLLPVVHSLDYVHVFILNLLQAINVFLDLKDGMRSFLNVFFGSLYSIVACCTLNLLVALPSVICIVISWIVTYRNIGGPNFTWIFFPCILIWALKYLYESASTAVVLFAIITTAYKFAFKFRGKSLVDAFIIAYFIGVRLMFSEEESNVQYLISSYGLAILWMWLKSVE